MPWLQLLHFTPLCHARCHKHCPASFLLFVHKIMFHNSYSSNLPGKRQNCATVAYASCLGKIGGCSSGSMSTCPLTCLAGHTMVGWLKGLTEGAQHSSSQRRLTEPGWRDSKAICACVFETAAERKSWKKEFGMQKDKGKAE